MLCLQFCALISLSPSGQGTHPLDRTAPALLLLCFSNYSEHRCLKHWHLITQQQREGSLSLSFSLDCSTYLNILKTNDSLNQNDLFYDQKLKKELKGSAGNPHNSLWPT